MKIYVPLAFLLAFAALIAAVWTLDWRWIATGIILFLAMAPFAAYMERKDL